MRRLRDFASIDSFFSDREIDEIQAAVDARREARAVRAGGPATPVPPTKTNPHAQRTGGPPPT